MKAGEQINHRARLFKYYSYNIDKPNHQVVSNSVEVKLDSPRKRYYQDLRNSSQISQTIQSIQLGNNESIRASKVRKGRRLRDKISEALNQQQKSPVKLPPIRKSQQESDDWKKYYNEHNLQSIKLDVSTLRLMEQNQKRHKLKHRSSIA